MKNKSTLCLILFAGLLGAQTEFRFDGVAYKTLYPRALCDFLALNPGTRLIDVRSPGEFADTSSALHLNIGRLKNAINISIDSIGRYIPKLRERRELPVVLYCSHSQRSRRVSKLLADSGFTNVFNLNGGMTWLNQASEKGFPCKREMIVTNLPFRNLSAREASEMMRNLKGLAVIDLRSESEFENRDTLEHLHLGRLKGAINIPAAHLMRNPSLLKINKESNILLYDYRGSDSKQVAGILVANGYTHIFHLLGGITAFIGKDNNTRADREDLLENQPPYTLLNTYDAIELLGTRKDLLIIDTRSNEEFNNKSKQPWKNLGNVKGAINLPYSDFEKRASELTHHKSRKTLVYGTDAARCCRKLREAGHSDVCFMQGGIWDLIYVMSNVEGFGNVRELLENNKNLY